MTRLDLPGAEVDTQASDKSRFGAQAVAGLRTAFERSLHPMLLCDDHRRLVSGNFAACDLLGIAWNDLCWLTMDVFSPPAERQRLEEQWTAFLASGAAEGWYELEVPGHDPVRVEFSATANVLPSRHLLIFVPPDEASSEELEEDVAQWAPVVAEETPRSELTEREREILTLVAAGLQSGDIAERLFLSSETVKSHVYNAMGKLGSHTRAHAVAMALGTGQITWEPERTPPGA